MNLYTMMIKNINGIRDVVSGFLLILIMIFRLYERQKQSQSEMVKSANYILASLS